MKQFKLLKKTSHYSIKYCFIRDVDIYDSEISDLFHIIFNSKNRKCLIKNRDGLLYPNPYFLQLNKNFPSFNLCYLIYYNNEESDIFDSDFDIGFNNSTLDFDNTIYNLSTKLGYHVYKVLNNQLTSKDVTDFGSIDFNGFVLSKKQFDFESIKSIDCSCNNLDEIENILSYGAVMILRIPYYSGYNYLIICNDDFNICEYIKGIFCL
ncbi:MAG TPA: hypothetical protein DIW26_05125 [Ruminococcus sp.]|nr:hypothetical protein [Ruminococcus sp.]